MICIRWIYLVQDDQLSEGNPPATAELGQNALSMEREMHKSMADKSKQLAAKMPQLHHQMALQAEERGKKLASIQARG